MTLAELIALVETLSKAVSGVTDRLGAQDKKIATLEGKVQVHDTQLKPFPKDIPQPTPTPAPSGPGGTLTFTTAHPIPDAKPK